jgi:hypothetical protein
MARIGRIIDSGQRIAGDRSQTAPSAKQQDRKVGSRWSDIAVAPERESENTVRREPASTTSGWRGLNRMRIDAAIKSGDKSDVHHVPDFSVATVAERRTMISTLLAGWTGPFDELVIEHIWAAYDDAELATEASGQWSLWTRCVAAGAELDDLPAVGRIKRAFASDVKELAFLYLGRNRDYVFEEMSRLGLQVGAAPVSGPTAEQASAVAERQRAAADAADLINARRGLQAIPVGRDISRPIAVGDAVDPGHVYTSYFNPEAPPALAPDPGENLTPWPVVKAVDNKLVAALSELTVRYPAVYALAFGHHNNAGAASAMSPEAARTLIGESLSALVVRIESTASKILDGDLDYRDLTPIHAQLFAGKASPSGFNWAASFPQFAAKDLLSDYETKEFWTTLGLSSLAAAAFVVAELATAGTAVFVAGAVGVGAGVTQAGLSWERYLDLAEAAETALTPDTTIISQGQVDSALLAAVLDSAFALMDAHGFAKSAISKGGRLAISLSHELRPQLVRLGLDDAAIARVINKSEAGAIKGQLFEEMTALRAQRMLAEEGGREFLAGSRAGEELEFIAGHRIKDPAGRQFSDGVIAVRRGERLEVLVIFEAKAGKAARKGLRSSYEELTKTERLELRAEAIEDLRLLRPELDRVPSWVIEKGYGKEVDALEEKISLADMGQVQRDVERGTPNAGTDFVTLGVDGVDTAVVIDRPSSVKFVSTLPSDVKPGRFRKLFGEAGIDFESIGLPIREQELNTLAEAIETANRAAALVP